MHRYARIQSWTAFAPLDPLPQAALYNYESSAQHAVFPCPTNVVRLGTATRYNGLREIFHSALGAVQSYVPLVALSWALPLPDPGMGTATQEW
jgi:hypothetical protein